MLLSFLQSLFGSLQTPIEKTVSDTDPLPTTPLRRLGLPKGFAVSGVSAKVALTPTTTAISLSMVGCNARFTVSVVGTDAVLTDHRILDGERIEVAVPAGSTVAAIAESGTGSLAISELL